MLTWIGVSVAPAPRNCGPPESPLQVPPSPVAWVCAIRSQAGFSAQNCPTEYHRSIGNACVIPPGPVVGSWMPYPTDVNSWFLSEPSAFISSSNPAVGSCTGVMFVTGLSSVITAMSSGSDCDWLYSGFVCIVPCSSFDFDVKLESKVTQMSL